MKKTKKIKLRLQGHRKPKRTMFQICKELAGKLSAHVIVNSKWRTKSEQEEIEKLDSIRDHLGPVRTMGCIPSDFVVIRPTGDFPTGELKLFQSKSRVGRSRVPIVISYEQELGRMDRVTIKE